MKDLPALIQDMLDPAFYPHDVVEPVHVVQAQVSYAIPTRPFAYKLKKPVEREACHGMRGASLR